MCPHLSTERKERKKDGIYVLRRLIDLYTMLKKIIIYKPVQKGIDLTIAADAASPFPHVTPFRSIL